MAVVFIILAIVFFIVSVSLHKSADRHEKQFNNRPSKINSPSNDLLINQKYAIINIIAFAQGTNALSAYSDEANNILNQWLSRLGLSQSDAEKSIRLSMNLPPEKSVQIIVDSLAEIRDKDFVRLVHRDVARIAQISGDRNTIELINDLFNEVLTL